MKVLIACSSGGHLAQVLQLRDWLDQHQRIWVTAPTQDARSKLMGEHIVYSAYPTTRSITALIKNLWLAVRLLRSEKPDLVLSTGAAVAVPFFWGSKFFGTKTVYIEVFDRIDSATLSGKLCRPVADLMLVQWPEQLDCYRGAKLIGRLW